jgi:hypothetical protein
MRRFNNAVELCDCLFPSCDKFDEPEDIARVCEMAGFRSAPVELREAWLKVQIESMNALTL